MRSSKGSGESQAAYAEKLEDDDAVMKAVSCAHMAESFKFDLMGAVVALIVALAGGLALVVLFTLANTNVSEREREMATLKVLGFFDKEVHHYVNREMMVLTMMGVVLGLPLGRFRRRIADGCVEYARTVFRSGMHAVELCDCGRRDHGFRAARAVVRESGVGSYRPD